MKNAIAVAAALAAPALAQSVGNAVVINSCSYPVYMENTPSSGGGFNTVSQTLSPGGTYQQEFTQLSNGNGWSIKLSKNAGAFGSNILQYEYTWQGWTGELGGILWFDLSDVDGNPWDGNWEISGSGSCSPRQAAYRFSTDDAYGEQSCSAESDVTVELCSAEGSGSPGPSPSSWSSESSWGAPTTPAVPSATSAPAPASTPATIPTTIPASIPTSIPTAAPTGNPFNFQFQENGNVVSSNEAIKDGTNTIKKGGKKAGNQVPKVQATTMATQVVPNRGGVTVTEVATTVVTNFVTAAAEPTPDAPVKRHQHLHARHPHHRHF